MPWRVEGTAEAGMWWGMQGAAALARAGMCPPAESLLFCAWSYKRVKGRSHTVEKLISMNQPKPNATS